MRIDLRIRRVGAKTYTTEYEVLGDSPAMRNFYPNTEAVSSLPFDTEELILSISSVPFAAGEVALTFPPLPFYRSGKDTVRYQHTIERKGASRRKPRRAPNTPELGVTLAYVEQGGP